MKLSAVVPILNQPDLARTAIDYLLADPDADVIALDNGSNPPFDYPELLGKDVNFQIIRLEKNIGVYPTFFEALKYTNADIVAFFHSDLFINEINWSKRIIDEFEANPRLGLIGFVGSNEIDSNGGRGGGTTSNFQGLSYTRQVNGENGISWVGSSAGMHGMCNGNLTPASVVDGCAMVFRRSVLDQIKQRLDFPPHHFYDRLLSCEVRELGFEVGVLGIGCDHISGQSVNGSGAYEQMAEDWATAHDLTKGDRINWDAVIYQEAERQWLFEYRDQKHLVPCRV